MNHRGMSSNCMTLTVLKFFILDKAKQKPGLPDPYAVYNRRASITDRNFVQDCSESMDSMMVFVSRLFSMLYLSNSRTLGGTLLSSHLHVDRNNV